jgi:hypothetical protein
MRGRGDLIAERASVGIRLHPSCGQQNVAFMQNERLLGFWVMGPEMPRVRAVGKECGLKAHRTEQNTEGSDLARITGSSCCNQDGVHCRSDMRQSLFC